MDSRVQRDDEPNVALDPSAELADAILLLVRVLVEVGVDLLSALATLVALPAGLDLGEKLGDGLLFAAGAGLSSGGRRLALAGSGDAQTTTTGLTRRCWS